MPIVKTYDLQNFINEFWAYGREDQFSTKGLEVIFDYLSDYYSDSSFEMDVIAICCGYTEQSCADVLELNSEYIETNDDMDNEELSDAARDYLNNNCFIVGEYENNAGETVFVFISF